jgi:hypothetical protein
MDPPRSQPGRTCTKGDEADEDERLEAIELAIAKLAKLVRKKKFERESKRLAVSGRGWAHQKEGIPATPLAIRGDSSLRPDPTRHVPEFHVNASSGTWETISWFFSGKMLIFLVHLPDRTRVGGTFIPSSDGSFCYVLFAFQSEDISQLPWHRIMQSHSALNDPSFHKALDKAKFGSST